MNQLLEAISYMQMCGVVHRDLKPENILVEKDM
jgi:serine/threonine protein kinase